jgi:hypothetical protein
MSNRRRWAEKLTFRKDVFKHEATTLGFREDFSAAKSLFHRQAFFVAGPDHSARHPQNGFATFRAIIRNHGWRGPQGPQGARTFV